MYGTSIIDCNRVEMEKLHIIANSEARKILETPSYTWQVASEELREVMENNKSNVYGRQVEIYAVCKGRNKWAIESSGGWDKKSRRVNGYNEWLNLDG